MGAISIGALRYDMVVMTDKMRDEIRKMRSQMQFVNRTMRDNRTPVEQYQQRLDRLRIAFQKGQIDNENYIRSAKRFKTELQSQIGFVSKAEQAQEKLNQEIRDYAKAEAEATKASQKRMQSYANRQGMSGPGGGGAGGGGSVFGVPTMAVTGGLRMMGGALAKLATPIAVVTTGIKAIGMAWEGSEISADIELMATDFEVLTGSVEKGTAMMDQFKEMAMGPPFGLDVIGPAGQTLLSFGVEADKVADTIARLTDVSGGNARRMESLALVWGQVTAQGKVNGGDIRQFINAGWNPLNAIVERTGETMEQVRKRMAAGNVTLAEMEQALEDVTGAGGMFEGRAARMSDTLRGQQALLESNRDKLRVLMGEWLMPIRKGWVSMQNELLEKTMSSLTWMKTGVVEAIWGPPIQSAAEALTGQLQAVNDEINKMYNPTEAEGYKSPFEAQNEDVYEMIDGLMNANRVLRMGAVEAERYAVSHMDASQAVKDQWLELSKVNEQLKKAAEETKEREATEKRIAQWRKQQVVERQQERVEEAQDQLKQFDEMAAKWKDRGSLGQVGASGPGGEYDFFRDRQRARQQKKEEDKMGKFAEQQRERYIQAVEQQKAVLEQIRDKQESERVFGV